MSRQIFLTEEEVLDLLLAELPEGVYPEDRADDEDPDKRSISSSELRAMARIIADLYANLSDINDDKHLTTVTPDGLAPHEKDLFSSAQDSTLSFTTRKQNLISKLRSSGGISLPAIRSIVDGILTPVGLTFDIFPFSGQDNGGTSGAWLLGVSELGVGTWLSELDPIMGTRKDLSQLDCSFDYVDAGLTADQLAAIQRTAYTYEVRIYGTADASTIALLDMRLTEKEPARSTHIITNGASTDTVDIAAYEAQTPEFSRLRA